MVHRILLGLAVAALGALTLVVVVVAGGMASAFRSAQIGDDITPVIVAAVLLVVALLLAGVAAPRWRPGLVAGVVVASGLLALLAIEIARTGGDPSLYVPAAVLGWWIAYAAARLRSGRHRPPAPRSPA